MAVYLLYSSILLFTWVTKVPKLMTLQMCPSIQRSTSCNTPFPEKNKQTKRKKSHEPFLLSVKPLKSQTLNYKVKEWFKFWLYLHVTFKFKVQKVVFVKRMKMFKIFLSAKHNQQISYRNINFSCLKGLDELRS